MKASAPATLRAVMSRLRDRAHGCPWDLEQDHQSLARHLREEAAEALDALAAHVPGDPEKERHLREELGDLLLQVAFHAQLAAERGAWDLHDVEHDVVQKLLRRHPHVFGNACAEDADAVLVHWAAVKRGEKAARGEAAEPRLLEGIPKSLSPLEEALVIGRRSATPTHLKASPSGRLDRRCPRSRTPAATWTLRSRRVRPRASRIQAGGSSSHSRSTQAGRPSRARRRRSRRPASSPSQAPPSARRRQHTRQRRPRAATSASGSSPGRRSRRSSGRASSGSARAQASAASALPWARVTT